MSKLLPIVLLLVGCSDFFDREKPKPDDMVEKRQQLEELYHERLSSVDWVNGIPSLTDCDGALWAGVSSVGGVATHLEDFIYPEVGKTQRRPGIPCFPDDLDGDGNPDSRSTTSNDQIIGLGYGLYVQGKYELINGIIDYGRARDWFMGEPRNRLGEIVLKPNVQITLQRSTGRISKTPTVYTKVSEDYQYHIQVLNILWEEEVEGDLSQNAISRLREASEAYPSDYLFQAAYGCYSGDLQPAADLLLAGINPSSYVRGKEQERLALANWLMSARTVLRCSK